MSSPITGKVEKVRINTPLVSLGSAILLVVVFVVLVETGHAGQNGDNLLIGLLVTTIPSLIAAAYAERTSRDVRNGVLTQKAKEGTHQALQESGVQDVVDATQKGDTVIATLTALSQLLTENKTKRDALARLLEDKEKDKDNG